MFETERYGKMLIMEDFNKRLLKARKEYIIRSFRSLNLNEMQMQAVLATEGPLLVLAGAGSGKTTVLINRILNLTRFGSASDCDKIPDEADEEWIHALENSLPEAEEYAQYGKAAPWRILAITFTNKAANEIKERLGKSIGEGAEDIWAGTFHSVCVKILRRDADKIGYSNSFTIYDRSDSESMIKRILKDMNIDEKAFVSINTVQEIIGGRFKKHSV